MDFLAQPLHSGAIVRNSRAVRNRGLESRLQKVGGEDLWRLHGEERTAVGRALDDTVVRNFDGVSHRNGGRGGEVNLCRVKHFVDKLDSDERTRTVLHSEKFRLGRGLERRAQHGLCPRCAADDDLYGFSEAKGLAELSIRQQLILPRGDDDLVDALHAVDREQCAHKDRDAVKGLQQLVLPAVARGASGGRNQRGAVRMSAVLALAEHLLQQAHGLNRSPLTASRR